MEKQEQQKLDEIAPQIVADANAALEGFALTGEYVFNLKDKSFEIVKLPFYRELPDLKDKTKTVRKLVLGVKLATGEVAEYFPNKTSIATIANKVGSVFTNWIGLKGKFRTMPMIVGGGEKNVIYVVA